APLQECLWCGYKLRLGSAHTGACELLSPADAVTSVFSVDELIELRRSRRARRWTLSVPWGSPTLMTIPSWMQADDVAEIIDSHREWIALERAKQRPRLRLDPRSVSE